MSSDFNYSNLEENTKEVQKVTIYGLVGNAVLTVLKILIGYLGGSTSVIADGIHSLSDCSTDLAVIFGVKFWNKAPDEEHPYGHRRLEAIIAVSIGVILGIVGLMLVYSAVNSLHTDNYQIPGWSTLAIAIISVIIKEWLYHWTFRKGEQLKSLALKANAWHHRSDAISSIPVVIAISFAKYDPTWAMLDPIASVAVSFFILQAAFSIARPALFELTDGGATAACIKKIEEIVVTTDGVQSMHCLRSRYYGSGLYVDFHLQVEPTLTVKEGHEIAGRAKRQLFEYGPDIVDVLIHVEPGEPRKEENNG